MLGGMGAACSKDVPRVPRRLAWSSTVGLAARTRFMEQVWKGFLLVPWFCTIWSVASLTLKKHKPQTWVLGARPVSAVKNWWVLREGIGSTDPGVLSLLWPVPSGTPLPLACYLKVLMTFLFTFPAFPFRSLCSSTPQALLAVFLAFACAIHFFNLKQSLSSSLS